MDRAARIFSLGLLAATLLTPALALAQAPPKGGAPVAPKSEQLDSNGCARGPATTGKGGGLDTGSADGRSLSDRLARSGGVICPPEHTDPAIKAPTPPGGTMPVIPPPGSPGGNPNIQPK